MLRLFTAPKKGKVDQIITSKIPLTNSTSVYERKSATNDATDKQSLGGVPVVFDKSL
jgi:hypothetical protein